jgi:hypothetical protein
MPHSAIAVFTATRRAEILEVGGSASWVVAEKQARRQEFLVCVRNVREVDFHDHEPHGTAFLVGRISGLKAHGFDRKGMQRWIIEISQYALVNYPEKWGEWRNPVKYTTLEELGIDLEDLKFQPMPAPTRILEAPENALLKGPPFDPADLNWKLIPYPTEILEASGSAEIPKKFGLTIAEAKAGLALKFGVPPESIEILIKG